MPDGKLVSPCDLENRARKAYFRRFGPNADQPSLVECKGGCIRLRNVRGKLACYQITKGGGLRYVEDDR
jgi:hypothetical protein